MMLIPQQETVSISPLEGFMTNFLNSKHTQNVDIVNDNARMSRWEEDEEQQHQTQQIGTTTKCRKSLDMTTTTATATTSTILSITATANETLETKSDSEIEMSRRPQFRWSLTRNKTRKSRWEMEDIDDFPPIHPEQQEQRETNDDDLSQQSTLITKHRDSIPMIPIRRTKQCELLLSFR